MMNAVQPVEPVISLTQGAAHQIKHLAEQDAQNEGKYLRVYVEQGGCSGMQYGMVFDEERPGDARVEMFGVAVLVDGLSAEHIRGAVVDFNDGLNSSGFKITNPNARESCGCGKSFTA